MPTALGDAIGFSAGLAMLALVSATVAVLSRTRSFEPNGLIGLRTKATRSSVAAWHAGHDAARPVLWTVAVVSVAASVVLVTAALVVDDGESAERVVTVSGLAAYGVSLTLVVWAGIRADRAARRQADHPLP